MITISEVVEQIVKSSSFLEEGISQEVINFSSLARQIRPQVEEETMKEVTDAAIMMALKRLAPKIRSHSKIKKVFKNRPDMIVRSNLVEYTVKNSESLIQKHRMLLEEMEAQRSFLVLTQGVFETTIISSRDLKPKLDNLFQNEEIRATIDNLSAITIRLPEETVETPAVFYFIHKILVWEGINVIEVASTFSEFTIILREKDVDKAFSVLKRGLKAD